MTKWRPRTDEELRALPEGPAFSQEEFEVKTDDGGTFAMVDGARVKLSDGSRRYCRPVMPDVIAYHSEPDDPIAWVDDGGAWLLGRYADGSWFKQRRR